MISDVRFRIFERGQLCSKLDGEAGLKPAKSKILNPKS